MISINIHIFIISRLLSTNNKKLLRRNKLLNIFELIKEQLSTRQVVEYYGLRIGRNGMACCPFHNDKHPSMKVDDTHYHCFGCGAHGDAISYVAKMYSLSQYEAANRIVDDFHLTIDTKKKVVNVENKNQMAFVERVQKKFKIWVDETINELKECESLIKEARDAFISKEPGVAYISNGLAYMLHYEARIGFWLDILCLGSEEEKQQLFFVDGEEVKRIAANIKRAGNEILGKTRERVG